MTTVCVAGLWHLGLVTAAGLAEHGRDVVGVDSSAARAAELALGRLPVFEPGLAELVKTGVAAGRLKFESDLAAAASRAGAVMIAYDAPVDDKDDVDLAELESALDAMIPRLRPGALVIVNSQVPAGTCGAWRKRIEEARPGEAVDLVYSPENLRLGQALALFKNPDMIVIGADSERARAKAEEFYRPFPADKIFTSLRTAETAKHALNAFFATSVSFANELGDLCEALGADGQQIAAILKKDGRIGSKAQVRPGLGFAGATLARDVRVLQKLGRREGVATTLFDSVLAVNARRNERIVRLVSDRFGGRLSGRAIAVLGLTYKPGTSTLRRSASLEIIKGLSGKGAKVRAHDPKADAGELTGSSFFEFCPDAYSACRGGDAILLLTEWPEYKDLDFRRIKESMTASPFLLDAKNHLDGARLTELGFDYLQIGRGAPRDGAAR